MRTAPSSAAPTVRPDANSIGEVRLVRTALTYMQPPLPRSRTGPMVTYAEKYKKLVAIGSCTPSGCAGCNGIHVATHANRTADGFGTARARSTCSRGCVKTSTDGGKSWSHIRIFSQMSPGGQINYDRVSGDIIIQHPSNTL